jgi:hypothetical protein
MSLLVRAQVGISESVYNIGDGSCPMNSVLDTLGELLDASPNAQLAWQWEPSRGVESGV